MEKLKITQHENDLFARIYCTCDNPDWKGTEVEHIMKTNLLLTGYNDDYYFGVVNAEPHHGKCHVCGRGYTIQWKPDGVDFEWEVR